MTNKPDVEESDVVTKFVSLLDQFVPPTANAKIPPRFAFGVKEIEPGLLGLAAEVQGSTTWIGYIAPTAPDEIVADRFDWFSGSGSFSRSSDADERSKAESADRN